MPESPRRSISPRWRAGLLAVAAAALVSGWLVLGRRENKSAAPAVVVEPSPANAVEAISPAPPSSVIPATAGPEPTPEVSWLSAPVPQEQSGKLGRLYTVWDEEPADQAKTAEVRQYFAEAFVAKRISAKDKFVRCSTSLCRARFTFESLTELYRLQEIEPQGGIDRLTTYPLELGPDLSISVYFSTGERTLEQIADDAEP